VSFGKKHGVTFGLTHNYTGYPLVKQARALVSQGKLGTIRKVVVEYPQGWLATPIDLEGQKQAAWRTDPTMAGISSCMGDLGSHAENLARYITGLEMEALCADLTTFVRGRKLDDDGNVLVQYKGGARGILYASQISVGEENNLRIRVYGERGSLEWHQENPNYLYVRYLDKPGEVYTRGSGYLDPVAAQNQRLPYGHPEGFIEAFANIYVRVGNTIKARLAGMVPEAIDLDFPTVQDGAIGVHFIAACVESSRKRGWIQASYTSPA